MNYVQALRGLRNEINRSETEHREKMNVLRTALDELSRLNTVCEKCEGAKGRTYRIVAEDDPEWHECSECHGTGKAKK